MSCPFGFGGGLAADHQPSQDSHDKATSADKPKGKGKKKQGAEPPPNDADRFDYHKDPVSWFYQNQIRSEEEFQANKERLRDQARERLDAVFAKKGKKLLVDSDDDDFSIGSSEVSAWDSDVASLSSMVSCADEWAQEAKFGAPADSTMKYALLAMLAISGHCAWRSWQAFTTVDKYWGVITYGWLPIISAAVAGIIILAVMALWATLQRRSRRGLMAFQMCLHVMLACALNVAVVCWIAPAQTDSELKNSACKLDARDTTAKICRFLPVIQDKIELHMRQLLLGNAAQAAGCLALLLLSSWCMYEVCYVEKKATKHKRRRRHRSKGIPWDKIKIENMGPVSFCGGPPPAGANTGGGNNAQGASKGGAKIGTQVAAEAPAGRCPFAGMMGGAAAAAAAPAGENKKTA